MFLFKYNSGFLINNKHNFMLFVCVRFLRLIFDFETYERGKILRINIHSYKYLMSVHHERI